MQLFGFGILELMVILVLAILVIGPDRVPGFAADLARWIRQARAYANYLMRDFNQVVGELQKEAGVTREDWKEIEGVINRHTGDLAREIRTAANTIESTGDTASNGAAAPAPANGHDAAEPPPIPRADRVNEMLEEATDVASGHPAEAGDKPWYEPQRRTRSRRRAPE